jgi:hypothetical protein
MARIYKTLKDGEIRVIPGRRHVFPHKLRCCDCGLTHLVVMRITSPSRAEFAAWRDKRATAAKRRRA